MRLVHNGLNQVDAEYSPDRRGLTGEVCQGSFYIFPLEHTTQHGFGELGDLGVCIGAHFSPFYCNG